MTSAATNVNWAGAAGNAVLAFAGHWTWKGIVWAFRHPVSSGMAMALSLGIGFGGVNAMFLQTARHPAPLFMDSASIAHPPVIAPQIVTPQIAAPQPVVEAQPYPVERTPVPTLPVAAVAPQAQTAVDVPTKVGNKEVAELQARLTELGFFSGKIDGYYGPMTADSIRRFETQAGLNPKGAVTPEVIAAAKAYLPKMPAQPVVQTAPSAVPVPVIAPENDPIGRIAAGLAENEQVATAVTANPEPEPVTVATRQAANDPELIRMVQTGLSNLGFLHGELSGRFDGETARAIREFENYNNFRVTGELTSDLVDVLMAADAFN